MVLGDALQRVSFLEPFGTPYVVWPSPFSRTQRRGATPPRTPVTQMGHGQGVRMYYSWRLTPPALVRIEPSPESVPDLADPPSPPRRRCGLDRQGWIEALAGLVIALIALLTSYDHIALLAAELAALAEEPS